jgi:hypothetical protein
MPVSASGRDRSVRERRAFAGVAAALALALVSLPAPARADEPALTGAADAGVPPWYVGRFGLELASGWRAPLGPVGAMASLFPVDRLSLAVGLGFVRPTSFGFEQQFKLLEPRFYRVLLAIRGDVLVRGRFRLGLGLGYSTGTYSQQEDADVDGRAVTLTWERAETARLDATLVLAYELRRFTLRLEGGVGRLSGDPTCTATLPSGVSTPCRRPPDPLDTLPQIDRPAPSRALPYVQLAVAARLGRRRDDGGGVTRAPPASDVRLLASASNARMTDIQSDGHYGDAPAFDVSAEGELRWRRGGALRYGLAGRYELGAGRTPGPPELDTEHFVTALALAGVGWSFPAGDEIEAMLGLGSAFCAFSSGERPSEASFLYGLGVAGELFLDYLTPLPARTDLIVGLGLRITSFSTLNGTGNFDHASGVHVALPLRIGLRWAR